MKNIFKKIILIITILSSIIISVSCEEPKEELILNTNFNLPDNITLGDGPVKVVLLLGQSNASGCSIVEYLQLNSSKEDFERYQNGYENTLINYCIDNHYSTSNGNFVKVDLTCGCGDGFFGFEVGFADKLNKEYNGKVIILKYTMSGYSLDHHWINNNVQNKEGAIYKACKSFVSTYLDCLLNEGIDFTLEVIMWMQGESDNSLELANKYYDNQIKLIEMFRRDFKKYNSDNDIYFIDAGISNSPYCEPGYPVINDAKQKISQLSKYNIYFSTIDLGLTTLYEPDYNPDLGHYDSLSCIKLGEKFGEEFLKIIK